MQLIVFAVVAAAAVDLEVCPEFWSLINITNFSFNDILLWKKQSLYFSFHVSFFKIIDQRIYESQFWICLIGRIALILRLCFDKRFKPKHII